MQPCTPSMPPRRRAGPADGAPDAGRRRLVGIAIAAIVPARPSLAQAGRARPTPEQMRGPYYPRLRPQDGDADLTRVRGRADRAQGRVVAVQGRVLDPDGRPLPGVRMEIWQANAAGRYRHPDDTSDAPLDPAFSGYASIATDAQGAWRIVTVQPGAYRIGGDAWRAPHVHFDIRAERARLVTQMYFPDEPLNATDVLLADCDAPELLVARRLPRVESTAGPVSALGWDIVLEST
jgi:protocatechuate 3,4-dioxygenase, beta subunit